MGELFLTVLNMSIAASWLIIAVVLLRFVLKKVPKWVNVLLWGIVVIAIVASVIVAICFLTNPANREQENLNESVPHMIEWFDFTSNSSEMKDELEISIDVFQDVRFYWIPGKIDAVTNKGNTTLLTGMPIWNCFFCDLNGDNKPELCATASYGSGLIDERVLVYDYAAGLSYEMSDRGNYDYVLSAENGVLAVSKHEYPCSENSVPIEKGTLGMKNGELVILHESSDLVEQPILDDVVSAAILNHFAPSSPDGLIHVESHKTLLTTQNEYDQYESANGIENSFVTVYLLVLHETFKPDSDLSKPLEGVGGSYIPTVLTFRFSYENGYVLEEYWEPRDGSYYTDDIKEKFPKEAQEMVWEAQDYVEALGNENRQKAMETLVQQGDFNELANELLTTICSSPANSSSPEEYIKEHQEEYDTLLSYDKATLQYCFREFLTGGQTDLRGLIMASLCEDIINSWGEAIVIDGTVSNGQDWFDVYNRLAKELEKQYSLQDLEKYYPGLWLLLQMSTEEVADSLNETGLPANEWPENQFTEGIPKPATGQVTNEIMEGEIIDTAKAYSVFMEEMEEADFIEFMKELEAEGYTKIASATEPVNQEYTSYNYIYTGNGRGISVSFANGSLVLRITFEEN